MDAGHPVDLLDPAPGVLVHPVARPTPVGTRFGDVLLRDQAVDLSQVVCHAWRLA